MQKKNIISCEDLLLRVGVCTDCGLLLRTSFARWLQGSDLQGLELGGLGFKSLTSFVRGNLAKLGRSPLDGPSRIRLHLRVYMRMCLSVHRTASVPMS